MNIDDDQFITGFLEKPNDPEILKGRDYLMASMGIYIFNSTVLMEYLTQNQQESSHDFGHDVIPGMVEHHEARAFHYRENNISTPYWRDVGDLLAYWQAQMELIENDNDLLNFSPIAGLRQLPFSKKDIVWKYYNTNHKVVRSSIAHTARIGRAVIKNSVVCPGVKVEDGVNIKNSVLLDGSEVAAGVDLSGRLVMPSSKVVSAAQGSFAI
jgi:glucose-1-phosphate adenylyltransferase